MNGEEVTYTGKELPVAAPAKPAVESAYFVVRPARVDAVSGEGPVSRRGLGRGAYRGEADGEGLGYRCRRHPAGGARRATMKSLNFTVATTARMANPARRVPVQILQLAIKYGKRVPDPKGAAGAFEYTIPMFRNGQQYTRKVVLRELDRTVLHFHYFH
jgi:hypothetical protein